MVEWPSQTQHNELLFTVLSSSNLSLAIGFLVLKRGFDRGLPLQFDECRPVRVSLAVVDVVSTHCSRVMDCVEGFVSHLVS
jgi:hypothetical protein